MKNTKFTIALDSDGVLADFERKVLEITGIPILKIPKKELWRQISDYDKHVAPFFATLPKMPDADILWEYVTSTFSNYFILTATGYTPRDGAQQKRQWYREHYGDVRIETVNTSLDKARFATPTTILIDDRMNSISPWVKAGGIGILHVTAKQSIQELSKLLEMNP